MSDSGIPTTAGSNVPPVAGASVQPQYAKRVMKVYAINETEVATISSLNDQATIFYSLASFLLSFAVGIYTNAMFATEKTPAGQIAQIYLSPLLILLSVVFIFLAFRNGKRRGQIWNSIKEESES